MELKDQVCSLEQAKKLKKLGVPQKSLWYWKLSGTKFILVDKFYLFDKNLHGDSRVYSAFTTAELGEMLPKGYASHKLGDKWYCLATEKDRVGVKIKQNGKEK